MISSFSTLVRKAAHQRVLHGLVDEMDIHQPRRVGDGGVAAIENADLHVLVGRDVLDELHADVFQRRPAGGEIVLQHPLLEALAEHRPIVFNAKIVREQGDLAIARSPG
jgi:hypothetical protein